MCPSLHGKQNKANNSHSYHSLCAKHRIKYIIHFLSFSGYPIKHYPQETEAAGDEDPHSGHILSARDTTPTQICQAHGLWSRQQRKRSTSPLNAHSPSAYEALTKRQAASTRCGAVRGNHIHKAPVLTELPCSGPSHDALLSSLGAPPGTDVAPDLRSSIGLGQPVVSRAQGAPPSVVKQSLGLY